MIVPVLGRPARVRPLLCSLRDSADPAHRIRPVFVCSAGDRAEIAAVLEAGHEPLILERPGRAEYARKINQAARLAGEEWLFTGADDLRFHPGWLAEALVVHERTGGLVVGTNDLGNPSVLRGQHATHSLVHRCYLEQGTVDQPGLLLHEGYDHNSCDCELVETAQARGVWAFAERSIVEHLHRLWGKAPPDATYRRGLRNARADRALFESRRLLWQEVSGIPPKRTAVEARA